MFFPCNHAATTPRALFTDVPRAVKIAKECSANGPNPTEANRGECDRFPFEQ